MNYELKSTGIMGLDKNLFENREFEKPVYGLPKGTIILVKGAEGSGKELLAKQFASGTREREDILYFATEEGKKEILNILEEYKWIAKPENLDIIDVIQAYNKILNEEVSKTKRRRGKPEYMETIAMSDFEKEKKEPEPGKHYYVCEDLIERPDFLFDLYNTFLENTESLVQYEVTPYRLIIDSLDFYLDHCDKGKVIDTIMLIANKVKSDGAIALMTMSSDIFSKDIEKRIGGIADCILGLKMEEKGEKSEHILEIIEVKNHPEKRKRMICYIDDNKRIAVQDIEKIG